VEAARSRADPWLVGFIAALFFLYVGVEVGFSGWVSSYAVVMKLGNEAEAALLASAFWGTFTVGRLAAIPIAARVRPRYVLLADLLGIFASLGLISLLPQSPLALWAGTLSAGLFAASVFPTLLALASRRLTLTGRITGFFFSVASVGSMVLPLAVGPLFEQLGPRSIMVAFTLNLVVMLGVWVALMIRSEQAARVSAA
jgi:fucose permease